MSYIIGSVAKCERAWSIAGLIRTPLRQSHSPIVFEAILFLNQNSQYWSMEDVAAALSSVSDDHREARSDKFAAAIEMADAFAVEHGSDELVHVDEDD